MLTEVDHRRLDAVRFPLVHTSVMSWTLVPAWVWLMLRNRRAFTAALVVTLFLPAAAVARADSEPGGVPDGEQATFSVQPAGPQGPDGRPNFSWGLTPGARLTDRVSFVNYSREPLPLTVYSTDAINTKDGGFGFLGTDDKAEDLGSWVTLKGVDQEIVVPPRRGGQPGTVQARLLVRVPLNASPGDHSAGVVGVLTAIDSDGGTQVKLEQRVASRVFARVSGDADLSLVIRDLSASYEQSWNPFSPGSSTVTYNVENTGNINLTASQLVRALGLVTDAEVAPPDLQVLLPGNSVPIAVTSDAVWPQIWMRAQVQVTPSDVIGENPVEYPSVTATTTFWAIPWIWVAILSVVALVAAVWWRQRRRVRRLEGSASELPKLVGV